MKNYSAITQLLTDMMLQYNRMIKLPACKGIEVTASFILILTTFKLILD